MTRSDSGPKAGIATTYAAEPTSTAALPTAWGTPSRWMYVSTRLLPAPIG